MKKKQSSLTEQILALSNPTPVEDADDFRDEDTTAKVADFDEAEEDVAKPSSLRKKTAHQSLDEDSRYKGLRTSRKAWSSLGQEEDDDHDGEDFMDDDDEEEDEVEEEEEEEDDELIAEKLQEMTRKLKGKKIDGESLEEEDSSVDDSDDDFDDGEDDEEEEDSDEEEEQDEEEEEDDEDDEEEEDRGIEGFSEVNALEEVEKGKAVQSQLGLWDSFMETRIKLQKALHLSNQLPQCLTLERFLEDEDDSEVQAVVKQSEKELVRLMRSLISLQDTLLEQNPETRHIIHGETPGNQTMNSGKEDDDDEEIPSDTDDEVEADKPRTPTPEVKRTAQKRKVDPSDFGEHLAKHHKSFESFRNNTIQRWYEKTRLSTGKLNKKSFSGFERSALVQIQQILQDQNRLVQRTQLKRSEYKVLGQRSQEERKGEDGEDEPTQDIPETTNQHLKNHDPEIFDDDDFYHQLLRELIERRTSSTTDPIQLTRQWLQVQKLRTKVKRQVDTKASKGRKLRYDVHQKLVSFMAPEDTSPMLPEARLELFKSLFGQSIAEEETAR